MSRIEDPQHFLALAGGYYVTGRFAALTQQRIAPNLMHHAIELLIKYILLMKFPAQRQHAQTVAIKKKYKHDLVHLWNDYQQQSGNPGLARFDAIVNQLHKWEDIRYGGFPTGTAVTIFMVPMRGTLQGSSAQQPGTFVLVLEDVDELFEILITSNSINPAFLGSHLGVDPALHEWYTKENNHTLGGLFT
jgi:hypothetical protein